MRYRIGDAFRPINRAASTTLESKDRLRVGNAAPRVAQHWNFLQRSGGRPSRLSLFRFFSPKDRALPPPFFLPTLITLPVYTRLCVNLHLSYVKCAVRNQRQVNYGSGRTRTTGHVGGVGRYYRVGQAGKLSALTPVTLLCTRLKPPHCTIYTRPSQYTRKERISLRRSSVTIMRPIYALARHGAPIRSSSRLYASPSARAAWVVALRPHQPHAPDHKS